MKSKTLVSIVVALALLQSLLIAPAFSQNAEIVHVVVRVSNGSDGSPVPAKLVSLIELEPVGHKASDLIEETNADGMVDFGFITFPGAWEIRIIGGSFFQTYSEVIQIAPGEARYDITVALEPKGLRPSLHSNKNIDQRERTLHIQVRGRLANGSLVPVHFATVYGRNGQHVATTDYQGVATARVREVMGETVYLKAEGSHWREATASFIVGASAAGTNFTRNDDYVTIVLNGENENTLEDLELAVRVRGLKNGKRVAVHFASVYDAEGRHLVTTDYNGNGTAHVKATLGESYVVKIDATHWKPATESVIVGSAGGAGSTTMYSHIDFLLQPEQGGSILTVEVLNHDTDKPVPAATVTLYKPNHFPGTAVASGSTNSDGNVTFDAEQIDSALLNGEARVGAAHGGSKSEVQTISGSLLGGESPHYVLYIKEKQENTKWSGTWYEGPYTIQISGGTGSLGYTFLRSDGAGTCCPLVDRGGGSCTVKGNTATCKWHGNYNDIPPTHDGGKMVDRSGHGTLTLSGDTISYHMVQDTGTITLGVGTCPDIAQCTGMHPGAENGGYWTRKKP
jgi:hypothetical protein